MPHMPGSATRVAASLAAAVFVASAIPHPTSMLDRLRFTWTGLRSMDRPSVVVRAAATLRIACMRTNSAIPCLVQRCQQKATVSSRVRRKKCLSDAMRCIDATENRRDSAVAAVRASQLEQLSRACRWVRRAGFRGRCSSQSGGSACCRCAARSHGRPSQRCARSRTMA